MVQAQQILALCQSQPIADSKPCQHAMKLLARPGTYQLAGEAGLCQAVHALRPHMAAAQVEVAQQRSMHHGLHHERPSADPCDRALRASCTVAGGQSNSELQLLRRHTGEEQGTWSTLFMKQVLPRLQRPRKPYGKLWALPMAAAGASASAFPAHVRRLGCMLRLLKQSRAMGVHDSHAFQHLTQQAYLNAAV